MQIATIPENEQARIQALLQYEILDTEAESVYDDFVKLASYICQTPIALSVWWIPLANGLKPQLGVRPPKPLAMWHFVRMPFINLMCL